MTSDEFQKIIKLRCNMIGPFRVICYDEGKFWAANLLTFFYRPKQ